MSGPVAPVQLDKLLAHKRAMFSFLRERWQSLIKVGFDVLLYDLTSTYFECDPPGHGKRRFGYSRDKRSDCVQVVIALIVTPESSPLAYEVMAGNTKDSTTLKGFLEKIEHQHGCSNRVWVMGRGIPTEAALRAMREAEYPVHDLVGTPRGRLSRLEKDFVALPWENVRESVQVKLLKRHGERSMCWPRAARGCTRSVPCAGAKDTICCAPICAKKTRRSCGTFIHSSRRSIRPSRNSRAA